MGYSVLMSLHVPGTMVLPRVTQLGVEAKRSARHEAQACSKTVRASKACRPSDSRVTLYACLKVAVSKASCPPRDPGRRGEDLLRSRLGE